MFHVLARHRRVVARSRVGHRCTALVLTLGVTLGGAAPAIARSSAAPQGGQASAGLMFAIVIPSVLLLDTRSGVIYSNDRRARMLVGSAPLVRYSGDVSKLHPVAATGQARAYAPGRVVARGLGGAEVLCVP
ncbi:MAG TPA: hypothetical protein VMN56_08785 [Casimicrobiaceae bacterium]|nr:hypothetical protein [Casimicrobiaceae bacterium]